MPISITQIRKIASLARIKLSPEEESRYAETISAVLDYMKVLNEVDTKGIEPTAQVTGLTNVFREDKPENASNKDALMSDMPQKSGGGLTVPGVFAEDEE